MHVFFAALAAGFALAAIPGPMTLLCAHRTLHKGLRSGLLTGAGIVIADTAWTLAAALCWAKLAPWIANPVGVRLAALMLVALGVSLWMATPSTAATRPVKGATDLVSAFAFSATNPMMAPTMAALMASFGPATPPFPFTIGIAVGSGWWWVLLSSGVSRTRHGIKPVWMQRLQKAGAVLLLVWGLHALLNG